MARRILLIEDETGIRDSVTDLIQTLGYVVKGCENGRMAMEKLPVFRPNLIISDIMMPEMDGIEFLSRIKSDNNYNDIPVVLLTAKSEFEDRIEGLQFGADNYLTKPFNVRELQLVIKNLFELKANVIKYSVLHSKESDETPNEIGFLESFIEMLDDHLSEIHQLNFFASKLELSESGFKKKLKRATGKSFQTFVREHKLEKARVMLAQGKNNVSETAYQAGFKSIAHFSDAFKKQFGQSPSNILVNR